MSITGGRASATSATSATSDAANVATNVPTTAATTPASFDSVSPATGEPVGSFPVDGPEQVAAAVARAREAGAWWAGLGFAERKARLLAFKRLLARRADELCDLVHRENGKPRDDALIEVLLVTEHLDWAARHARRVLRPRRVSPSLLTRNLSAWVEHQPFGVVGVIGPWNYPVFTPLGSIGYALAAGNAVVFKPSEQTPAVGRWLQQTFAEVVGERPVFQVVTGFGATGEALCRSGVDKIAFTGSPATGRKVMAACAERLTPVVLELGGKDAMIVDADADLDAAARAAVWGGIANAGQTCIGIERVYAVAPVYDRFVEKVVERARELRAGAAADADLGPITMPGQLDVIRRHLDDALARGGTALVGGAESVHPPFAEPVVLVDVPEDALVMREETFGPVLPITRVRDLDEAVARANGLGYGLGGAVFGRRRAAATASALRAGMVSVNSVQSYAGVAALPFGGVGESGFGRIHGEQGLRELSVPKSVVRQRVRLPLDVTTFERPASTMDRLRQVIRLRHGRSR
jgi:succinate-semialdehyde dehydrogenase / glutarate-semialdehyde dehydrogenase